MEEFLQTIITMSIIVFALASSFRKKVRSLEQEESEIEERMEENEPQLPEWWPRELTIPQPAPRKATKQTPQPLHPDSLESLESEISRAKRPKSPQKEGSRLTRHAATTTNPSIARTGQSEERPKEQTSAAHPLTADFDPQKAIIWAEIMKPKFEE